MYEKIVNDYYPVILSYCYMHLGNDIHAAEDCTQEVFLMLHIKIKQLNLSINIEGWLYAVADRKIREYRRKHPETVNIDTLPEQFEEPDFISQVSDSVLDTLNPKDRRLLEIYYSGENRNRIAERLGLTTNALYLRVKRIRKKLWEEMKKFHN